jgi:hypothetical protein
LANILVLPIIPITMLLGFVAGALAFVSVKLAVIPAWLAYLPLKYETLVISYLANLKYSAIEAHLGWLGLIVWYMILVAAVYFLRKKFLISKIS